MSDIKSLGEEESGDQISNNVGIYVVVAGFYSEVQDDLSLCLWLERWEQDFLRDIEAGGRGFEIQGDSPHKNE